MPDSSKGVMVKKVIITVFFGGRRLVKEGFSLIEFSVALMLLAIIVSFGLVTTGFLNNFLIKSEMHKMRMACLYMQQCAQVSNKEEQLVFNEEKGSYSFDGKTEYLASGIQFGVISGVQGPPAFPHAAIKKPITFTNNCITFYPSGSIQAGAVYCVDKRNNYLYALSCGINHTSHIRLYTYTDSWQLLT